MAITRLHGDFLQVSDQITDLSVDFLLTDPPYNISENGAKPVWLDENGQDKNSIHSQKFSESFEDNWDDVGHEDFVKQLDSWAQAWYPKLRKGAAFAVFISDKYISYLWHTMEQAGFEPKRIITWKKPAAVPFNRAVNPVSGCEFILWGIKPGGKRTFNASAVEHGLIERVARADKISSIVYRNIREGQDLDTALDNAKQEAEKMLTERKQNGNNIECVIPNTITYSGGLGDKIHPTQKPQLVLEYLIELCTRPGDLVLDTFAGSGSTGMAAFNVGRSAILIERDSKMFTAMNARFTSLDLFKIS